MGYIVGEGFIPPAGRRGRRPLQCQAGRFQIIINEQGRPRRLLRLIREHHIQPHGPYNDAYRGKREITEIVQNRGVDSPLPAQSRMPKRSSAMPFETLLLIRTTLLKFKYTTSLSRLYHKRGCRTRSNPMLQPLARTRSREKILKVLLLTFLSRKVRLTSR